MAADANANNTASTASSEATVGELVVTAEKREERLETVAVAVSAYSKQQRDLVGIQSVQDLTDFTPGLAYNAITNRPYVRGVGRNTDNIATESAVPVYSDGVYLGANAATILQEDTLFVDRIEVERGPQSTLFGNNADGGAINYVSVRPSKEFQAEFRTGVGNYNKWFAEGLVSGPVSDRVRLLIGGNYTSQTGAGYFNNLDGPPEGGSIVQGSGGISYYAEAQVDANVTDHLDVWGKVSTGDFNANYHTQAALGPQNYAFGGYSASLMPSPYYALCFLPAAQGGAPGGNGCPTTITSATQVVVPSSIVTLAHTANTPNLVGNSNLRDYINDFVGNNNQRNDIALAATATYHLPEMDIKYTGGYQAFNYDLYIPVTFGSSGVESFAVQGPAGFGNLTINPRDTHTNFIENVQDFSHELDFSSTNDSPLQWLGGLYWYHEHHEQPVDAYVQPYQTQLANPIYLSGAAAPANPLSAGFESDTFMTEDSVAAFAQFDYKFNDQWKITGGLRYSEDKKTGYSEDRYTSFDEIVTANSLGAATPAFDITSLVVNMGKYPGASVPFLNTATGFWIRDLSASWGALTGTFSIDWTPDTSTLIYAKYDRGDKTGGFNSWYEAPNPETLPETVDAYEVGLKKTIGQTFEANVAGFFYDYKNDQQPLTVFDAGSGTDFANIFNIPDVHTYGVELETIWRPIDPLTLSLNYSYLSAKVTNSGSGCYEDTSDPYALAPGAATAAAACTQNLALGYKVETLKGATLPQSAPNKISLNALYTMRFDPGNLSLSGSFIWKDATYDSIFNRPYFLSPAYTQVNLRATWTDVKSRYTVEVFCDNVFNAVGYDGIASALVSPTSVASAGIENIQTYPSLTFPRTFGIEFHYKFH